MNLAPTLFALLISPQASLQAPALEHAGEVSAEVAAAAARGLEWLAAEQTERGAWRGHVGYKVNQGYEILAADAEHVGVTALVGMAFLAGGHLPERGRYGEQLDGAVRFLVGRGNDLGFVTGSHTRMYSHAFATLFLAEVYGMTPRADVRKKLQDAVDLIVSSQNQQGSWRYEPFALESDMSITVCQLMALRAARNIGIKVPAATIDRAVDYVNRSLVRGEPIRTRPAWLYEQNYYKSGPGAFRYQIENDSRSSFALTAAGITSLYHAARYDPEGLRLSLEFLADLQDRVSEYWQGHYFYYYGHYYAVQAMFITGGENWRTYWTRTSRELLDSQRPDGRWENSEGPGAAFGTAVACIVLQTPYRYLPILQR